VEGESTILKRAGVIVPGIESIGDGPESSVEVVDKTPMGTRHKRKRASKTTDSGSLDVKVFWNPSDPTHAAINASRDDSPTVDWALVFADGTTHVFDGFVTSVKVTGLESESEAMLEFSVEIDGDVEETVA
jgi:hypothetical protein